MLASNLIQSNLKRLCQAKNSGMSRNEMTITFNRPIPSAIWANIRDRNPDFADVRFAAPLVWCNRDGEVIIDKLAQERARVS